MSNLSGITILAAEKQLDSQNWASFKDVMISLARGKGYEGYLTGTILCPEASCVTVAPNTSIYNPSISAIGQPTALMVNARTPLQEEWDLHDRQIGTMVYQNVKDPKAHGLSPMDASSTMWEALNAKFNWSSEVLKGLAFTQLRALKCKDGCDARL